MMIETANVFELIEEIDRTLIFRNTCWIKHNNIEEVVE